MNIVNELVESLTPSMVNDLKQAIELGKFPDGQVVSNEQKELMIEATILYDALKLPEEERTGFIHRKKQASYSMNVTSDIILSKDIDHD